MLKRKLNVSADNAKAYSASGCDKSTQNVDN